MFHCTTQTHRPTMVLVGGYIKCILLKDVFRKNNDTSFLKRRSIRLRREVSKNETLLYQMGVHFKR